MVRFRYYSFRLLVREILSSDFQYLTLLPTVYGFTLSYVYIREHLFDTLFFVLKAYEEIGLIELSSSRVVDGIKVLCYSVREFHGEF